MLSNTAPADEIPADDADLDAILRAGIHAGFWPFKTLPGALPASVLTRIAERTRMLEAAHANIAEAMRRNRDGIRGALLDHLSNGLGGAATA